MEERNIKITEPIDTGMSTSRYSDQQVLPVNIISVFDYLKCLVSKIGTTSPTEKLDVDGNVATDSVKATASNDMVINGSSGTGHTRCTPNRGRGNIVIVIG